MRAGDIKDRTQIVPFSGATDLHFRLARSFALVTDWAAALAGRHRLQDVIEILTRQVEAANVSLFRFEWGRPHAIATAARSFDDIRPEVSTGSLARAIRDEPLETLTPGSIWLLSTFRNQPGFERSALGRDWAARPHIVEVSLIVLEATPDRMDCLEIQFDNPPKRSAELPTSLITQALANAWEARQPGLVLRQIKRHGQTRRRESDWVGGGGAGVLGPDNPCGLSRAEQRVGHLLAAGSKASEVAEALGISMPTVRSHLRNLYSKTGVSGQVEFVTLVRDSDGKD